MRIIWLELVVIFLIFVVRIFQQHELSFKGAFFELILFAITVCLSILSATDISKQNTISTNDIEIILETIIITKLAPTVKEKLDKKGDKNDKI